MSEHRKKILVADCHEDVLLVLEKTLEDAGFDTTTVWTAKDALRMMDSRVFDLVLVNEYLPDAECEELLYMLHRKSNHTPCIVMQPSAPEITDRRRLQKLGVRDIVCKYTYPRLLQAIIDSLSRKSQVVTA